MLHPEQILSNRYKLIRQFGQNNGRQTWFAQDLTQHLAEPVVIKLLAFGDQVQWDDLKLFEREAQILRQLQHPQIPKYRDSFTIDDRILWFGLVQEYVPGMLLKDRLAQQGRLSEAAAKKLAIAILEILCYLHELNPPVLHRDIKPSNLILGRDHRVYLIDFGAVQDRAAREGATFTVVGTYGYTPMEQFGGRAVAASDLYALGATLIHTVTGIAPANLPQEKLRLQFRDRATLHPKFADWLQTLTEPDPVKRFQTARQALTALQDLQQSNLQPAKPIEYGLPMKLAAAESTANSPRPQALLAPSGTQVKLRKTPTTLVITYPGQFQDSCSEKIQTRFTAVYSTLICLVLGCIITMTFFLSPIALLLFSITLPLACLTIIAAVVVNAWLFSTSTTLCFDRDRHWITLKKTSIPLTGISLAKVAGVAGSLFSSRGSDAILQQQVVIRTQFSDLGIGRGLSAAECEWLIAEIESWLSEQKA